MIKKNSKVLFEIMLYNHNADDTSQMDEWIWALEADSV